MVVVDTDPGVIGGWTGGVVCLMGVTVLAVTTLIICTTCSKQQPRRFDDEQSDTTITRVTTESQSRFSDSIGRIRTENENVYSFAGNTTEVIPQEQMTPVKSTEYDYVPPVHMAHPMKVNPDITHLPENTVEQNTSTPDQEVYQNLSYRDVNLGNKDKGIKEDGLNENTYENRCPSLNMYMNGPINTENDGPIKTKKDEPIDTEGDRSINKNCDTGVYNQLDRGNQPGIVTETQPDPSYSHIQPQSIYQSTATNRSPPPTMTEADYIYQSQSDLQNERKKLFWI